MTARPHETERGAHGFRPLVRVVALWRGQVIWLAFGLLVSLAALACGIALLASAGARIVSPLAAATAATGLLAAGAALRTLGVARVMLRYGERLVTHDATFRALAALRVWFFRGLARSAAGGLGYRRSGDLLSRLVADIETLDGLYLRILLPLAGAAILIPALALLIAPRDAWLAAAVVALLALAAFVMPAVAAWSALALGDKLNRAASDLRVSAIDTVAGLREVHAYQAQGRALAALQAREGTLLTAQGTLASRSAIAGIAAFLCAQSALFGVLLTAPSHPALSAVLAFTLLGGFELVLGLTRAGLATGQASSAASRVLAAAESPPPVPEPARPATLPGGHALRFEAVSFAWQPDRPPVLDGLTLDVPEGMRVALLGPSGAGKSTIAALALRLASPQAGRVTLGGTDLRTLGAADLHTRFAWLSQSTHLFADTLRANLLLGDPRASDDALWDALDRAALADFARALPDGLDTWLGDGTARVSGGQGRRIALARALLSPAPILILDEPATGLDAEAEAAFFRGLNNAAPGRSLLLIVHRLTGVERLDRIYRLSAGRAFAALS